MQSLWNCDTNVKNILASLAVFFCGGALSSIPLRPVLISI